MEVDSKDVPEATGKASAAKDKSSKKGDSSPDEAADGKSAAKGDKSADKPGSLSIDCNPQCDSIIAGGVSLGQSPVFDHPMPPGNHRVTLKAKGVSKQLVVSVSSGQATRHNVKMK